MQLFRKSSSKLPAKITIFEKLIISLNANQETVMDELIGKVLQGYKIIQVLGRGGMGIVYRAYDKNLERYVAIKFLKSEIVDNPNLRERFKREAKNQAKLNHQNIVTVYGFLDYEGMLGIVMEYVEGTSLDKLIYSRRRLHLNDAIFLIKQVLSAVGYAHSKGFIHRDIKPSNIIVTKEGLAKIMDFGISKSIFDDNNSMTRTGAKVGTPFYMSPEQIKGKNVSHHTDIYALGCTLYEMITGDPPFMGDSEYEVLEAHMKKEPPKIHLRFPDIPPMIDEILAKALSKNPADRFQNCKEFYDAIVEFEKIKEYSPAGGIYGKRKKEKKRAIVPITIITGIVVALLFLMKFIIGEVDDVLKNKRYEKLEKYNLKNFFRSSGEYNFNEIIQIPTKVKYNINHIDFVNENLGFAVGDSGLVLRTVNGGLIWHKVEIFKDDSTSVFGNNSLYASYFFENGVGFIVGSKGTIIKTENLLQSAEKIPFLSDVSLFDIVFADHDIGIIVGAKGSIFRTEDGGKTWIKAKSSTSNLLYDAEFLTKNIVLAAGWNGELLRSTDAGFSWRKENNFTRKYIKSLSFKNDHYGLACGGSNNIFLTEDAGKSWKEIKTNNSLNLSKIKFLDEFIALAVGNRGVILLSKDAGESWGTVNSKYYYRLNDFVITPSGKLFIVGDNGLILKINPKE